MRKIDDFEKWLNEEINALNNDSMDGTEFIADYNSIEEMQNAADNGDGNACYFMGQLNYYKCCDAGEAQLAERYMKKGMEVGNRHCIVRYCEKAMFDDLYREPNEIHIQGLIELLEPLADVSAHADYVLGMIYSSFENCFNDYEKAVYYMRRAADNCDIDAICEMQLWYDEFYWLDVDDTYFFQVLLKSADKGDKRAMQQVSCFYLNGCGCEKNSDKAFEYADKAAKAGYGMAYVALGYMYEKGFGAEVDIDKAVDCYLKACNMGFNDGYYSLGNMYYEGKSVPKDIKLAVHYLRCAMDFNDNRTGDAACKAADLVMKIAKENRKAVDEETFDLALYSCSLD